MYRDFETRHRQALWNATHAIYLPVDKRDRDPELAHLRKQRKQRTLRSGPWWKKVFRYILQGMIGGDCNLNLFLDFIFMHLPSLAELRPYYPG